MHPYDSLHAFCETCFQYREIEQAYFCKTCKYTVLICKICVRFDKMHEHNLLANPDTLNSDPTKEITQKEPTKTTQLLDDESDNDESRTTKTE
ncbi:hypothetical protein ECANGB1_1457 [Enterospora canceri]|nr:hypothetical protein ECANGB1_1457 [Enterospora canceri]